MSASNTDKFKKARRKFSTRVGVGGCTDTATTIPLESTTGVDTDTAVVMVIDSVDANGNATPAFEEVVVGIISGSSLVSTVRGKEGTTAQAHAQDAIVTMYFTETHWDDLINGILVEHNQDGSHKTSPTAIQSQVINTVYPVGAIYISTLSTNPGTLFGVGTWAAFGAGRTLVSYDSSQTEFDTVEETGGEKTHILTTAEMPSHNHPFNGYSVNIGSVPDNGVWVIKPDGGAFDRSQTTAISHQGGDQPHNNLQPYIVTYMWKRTA